MPYHHEYHLAGTVDKEKEAAIIISPVISVKSGNRALILTRRILVGITALVVASLVIAMCVHPEILFDRLHHNKLDSEVLKSSLVLNDSITLYDFDDTRRELLKVVSPTNVYEHWYVRSLNQQQVDSILQLRSEVADQLPRYYMSRATYLSTWLRAKDWIVEDARDMLLDHLDFRVEYEIESILDANFTYFENELPYYGDGVDKRGGPVYSLSIEDWDLRKVTVGGGKKKFVQYVACIFERAIQTGAIAQDNGTNISQGMFILNVNKYNYAKHGCFTCLSLLGMLFGMDDNYPGWLHTIIVINSSDLADSVIDLMVPFLTGENRAAVKVFGFNKEEWQKEILRLVDADQLRPEFGGTKVDTHEY